MDKFSLKLNWFGMAVHDVPTATTFYNNKLGMAFVESSTHGEWRQFKTERMIFEMFQAHPNRPPIHTWGQGQAFRPVIQVSNLSVTATMLQKQNIPCLSTHTRFGTQLEMTGPEGFRWSLQEAPTLAMDWAHPVIGGIELKAANLKAQKDFYTQIVGMTLENETDDVLHLTQPAGEAWLRIEPGGMKAKIRPGEPDPAFFHPIWLSYETHTIKQVNDWLQSQKVTICQPLTYHPEWLGTDILLGDGDGNIVQIVQYGKRENPVGSA